MKPHYKDNHIANYNQDFRTNELPDNSVQCVVTSPPYWGLRKYSGEQGLIWGGDNHCVHEWCDISFNPVNKKNPNRGPNSCVGQPTREANKIARDRQPVGNSCSLCGSWRGAYGLEPTPEMYVQHTIEILREIRRVLRKDGVVFWNIGDSYSAASTHGGRDKIGPLDSPGSLKGYKGQNRVFNDGLKPKDLCLIPFRIAIAAQTDGWWVRSVIIWNKPNPMPESVTDRPTESHEYILMLTKSARYYWDQEAVREPVAPSTIGRGPVDFGGAKGRDYQPDETDPNFRNGSEQWGRTYDYTQSSTNGRNLRSVWSFPTQPYPEAHFAVFPEKLPELCIKAATPEVGCCAECGAPWERILDKKPSAFNIRVRDAKAGRATPEEGYKATQDEIDNYPGNHPDPGYRQTIGWQPTCKCNADKVPSIVLDSFSGAGTTLYVAKKLNRKAIGFDTSEEYCQLAVKRNRQQVMA